MKTQSTTVTHRTFEGVVVSTQGQKTLVVRVDRTFVYPKYGKRIVRSRKYHVHTETPGYTAGEKVRFVECRPISRTKRWRVVSAPQTAEVSS